MPSVNLYTIVTNDKYELPYVCDIKGRQATADFLGMSLSQFNRNIKTDKWKGKYKAVFVGVLSPGDSWNAEVIPLTKEERMEIKKTKRKRASMIRREKNRRESHDYYHKNRQVLLEKAKQRYRSKKEEGQL